MVAIRRQEPIDKSVQGMIVTAGRIAQKSASCYGGVTRRAYVHLHGLDCADRLRNQWTAEAASPVAAQRSSRGLFSRLGVLPLPACKKDEESDS